MEQKKGEVYVKVKDEAGNEFVCPISALKDRKHVTEEELNNCVDDAITHRYAGQISVEE